MTVGLVGVRVGDVRSRGTIQGCDARRRRLSAVANAKASTARAAPSASGNVKDQPKQRTDLDKWASASPWGAI